ncbi:ParB/RepB/Spo0J family partition protein [Streptomyces sp. NPDC048696]|uniref:ParB/RepB/Spo0J family partition protein n=1 Tax=Streptomyces sp. NPDC048696 TaxID=3365585 RepID=UPI003713D25F
MSPATSRIPASLADLTVGIDELAAYHRNPRTGDLDAIAESLSTHGQYKPIVVNIGSLTGRPNEVLAGNHTLKAAQRLGWPDIAVTWLDVDDDTAAKIVIVDNRTSDLAGYDSVLLADILTALPDLDGTGYDQNALDDLLDAVEIPSIVAADTVPPEGERITNTHLQWGYMQWGATRVQIAKEEVERLDAVHAAFYDRQGTDTGFAHYLLDTRQEEVTGAA